ncbi:STAS domain-containing protein [Cellulomonas sp. APG4]|uniref:STAS domain-containing protein n=1 Tax=Cellulomonas sp. APG4 TaxID=1538656 RepID=UPI0013799909|nr:STAS domain-containing protein [Cellulomonas sp. APG4]NCT89430.1 STAS domain-containing protein [Cellulomonas sp. APG4]
MDEKSPRGSITVDAQSSFTFVRLAGEVDVTLRPQASHALAVCVTRGVPVVVESQRATFADSYTLAFLLQLSRACGEDGVRVALPDPSPALAGLLQMTGTDTLFDLGAPAQAPDEATSSRTTGATSAP